MKSPLAGFGMFRLRGGIGFSERSLVIGLLPTLALVALMSGSLDNAVNMIVISTVCTGGIGGLFWVGLSMLVGTVLQLLVPALQRRTASADAAATRLPGTDPPGLGREDVVADLLVSYASAKLGQGASEEGIRRDLLWSGWSEPQATAALEQARAHLSAAPGAGSARVGDGS
jgi:hypothetical protein